MKNTDKEITNTNQFTVFYEVIQLGPWGY